MRCKAGLFSRFQPFSPAIVSGLTGWWDASDSATLFDATTGGSTVAADGGVARWEDKSGSGRHWVQGSSIARPSRKTSVLNALDVIRLDGSDDRMSSSEWSWSSITSGSAWSAFAVAKATAIQTNSTTNSNQAIVSDDSSAKAAFLFRATGVVGGMVLDSVFNQTTVSYTENTWGVFSLTFTANGDFSARVNGGTAGTSAVGSMLIEGGTPYLGFVPSGSRYFNGDVGELVFFNVALSVDDREAVESYLMDKWAIT